MNKSTKLAQPRHGYFLHWVRCGEALFYVRPEPGVADHFACRRCGQRHAAWKTEWEPFGSAALHPGKG